MDFLILSGRFKMKNCFSRVIADQGGWRTSNLRLGGPYRVIEQQRREEKELRNEDVKSLVLFSYRGRWKDSMIAQK